MFEYEDLNFFFSNWSFSRNKLEGAKAATSICSGNCHIERLIAHDYMAAQCPLQICILWPILAHLRQQSPSQTANILVVYIMFRGCG